MAFLRICNSGQIDCELKTKALRVNEVRYRAKRPSKNYKLKS